MRQEGESPAAAEGSRQRSVRPVHAGHSRSEPRGEGARRLFEIVWRRIRRIAWRWRGGAAVRDRGSGHHGGGERSQSTRTGAAGRVRFGAVIRLPKQMEAMTISQIALFIRPRKPLTT